MAFRLQQHEPNEYGNISPSRSVSRRPPATRSHVPYLTNHSPDVINQIIDLATPDTIAAAGIWGHEIKFVKSANPESKEEREKVEGYTNLFTSKEPHERKKLMLDWFPSKVNPGRIDVGFLRGWLKDVAEIMQWAHAGETRELLGVRQGVVDEQAELDEDHKRTNKEMDEIDKLFKPTLQRSDAKR